MLLFKSNISSLFLSDYNLLYSGLIHVKFVSLLNCTLGAIELYCFKEY